MTKDNIIIDPVTQQDINFFYPEGFNYSFRGWVGKYRNKLLGLGGYLLDKSGAVCLLNFNEKEQFPKKLLYRAMLKVFFEKICPSCNYNLYAIQDNEKPNSKKLLLNLGFVHYYVNKDKENVYIFKRDYF